MVSKKYIFSKKLRLEIIFSNFIVIYFLKYHIQIWTYFDHTKTFTFRRKLTLTIRTYFLLYPRFVARYPCKHGIVCCWTIPFSKTDRSMQIPPSSHLAHKWATAVPVTSSCSSSIPLPGTQVSAPVDYTVLLFASIVRHQRKLGLLEYIGCWSSTRSTSPP